MDNEHLLKSLGDRIRHIRKGKKISQERLAELSELHPTYISDIERGKVNASISTYFMVADALGITLTDLLNFQNDGAEALIGNEFASMLPRVKSLEKKKQTIFMETAKKLLASIEDL
jgi:transcriptional regulator with XRE-family HTH domain